jgi:1-deoxy-D-xylulose-5-phosphate synthase
MALLPSVTGPQALKRLSGEQCEALAAEVRDFLVDRVSRTGGHLGPNLGVVELTIALHRVFDSPHDRVIWDTGHQAYVHKILTGRQAGFDQLRQRGGLSGYPSREESVHDVVENSHASTALSYADGLAKAYALTGERDRSVVAVVGDGALTGGLCWEALNNIAGAPERPVIVVVNDNGRSYAPTTGGLADHLASLRMTRGYEQALGVVRNTLTRTPVVGPPLFDALHGMKRGLKDLLQPQVMFEDLGLKYVGPIDGHDIGAVESALRRARDFGGPVIVHCVTRKGYGYGPAEDDEVKCLHDVKVIDPLTGRPLAAEGATWTGVFGQELVSIAAENPAVVAVTASMLQPTGLLGFAATYPDRVFDVGIAEQHALTSAAGMAMGGLRPVVALYATFLNRAFDQLLLDAALHRLPVTVALDRAGVTGPDGASHHGMWDLSVLQPVPGIGIAAPRDGTRLRELLREAVGRPEGPNVVRYPTGAVPVDLPALRSVDGVDLLAGDGSGDVLLVTVGAMAATGVAAAERAGAQGISVTVVDPRWVLPVNPALLELAAAHRLVVSVEDGVRVGGVGSRLALALADAGVPTPVRTVGLPARFLGHGRREDILREHGLAPQELGRLVVEAVASLPDPAAASDAPATSRRTVTRQD